MSGTKRVRQVVQSEPKPLRRVRVHKSPRLTEVIRPPERHGGEGESKGEMTSRWRTEEELLRACVAEGMTRAQQKRLLDVRTDKELAVIEKRLLANEGQLVTNQSTAHRYFTYLLQQEQCGRDLEYVLSMIMAEMEAWNEAFGNRLDGDDEKMPPRPSAQSAIMAIKAKSELLDRTIKMGQDMGIIEKRAKELRVSGNLNLAALPTEELRTVLDKKLKDFERLVGVGKLPTVYEKMMQRKLEPHAKAALNGRDGSNLDPSIG